MKMTSGTTMLEFIPMFVPGYENNGYELVTILQCFKVVSLLTL